MKFNKIVFDKQEGFKLPIRAKNKSKRRKKKDLPKEAYNIEKQMNWRKTIVSLEFMKTLKKIR